MAIAPSSRTPAARRPGRPGRLSREQIISTTLRMLEGSDVSAFTVGKLAKELGASPMALYRYFPSRDALLSAAADHVFLQIKLPEPSDRWQDFVLQWMQTLFTLFQRQPLALDVIVLEEQRVSAGWLRVWLPLVEVLAKQEPDDERLAYLVWWFSSISIGFIRAHIAGPRRLSGFAEGALDPFPPASRDLLRRVVRHMADPANAEMLQFGFEHIVTGLEKLLAKAPAARDEGLDLQTQS